MGTRCEFILLYANACTLGSDMNIAGGALVDVDIDDVTQVLQRAHEIFPHIAAIGSLGGTVLSSARE
jgi:hypothetical protein